MTIPESSPGPAHSLAVIQVAARSLHAQFGPGLLESAYAGCLAIELRHRGCAVRTEVAMPILHRGVRLESAYRLDLLVDDAVVVEVKHVARVLDVHLAQLRTYLRLSGRPAGVLINFGCVDLRDGYQVLDGVRSARF